jgi:hypothetical protein
MNFGKFRYSKLFANVAALILLVSAVALAQTSPSSPSGSASPGNDSSANASSVNPLSINPEALVRKAVQNEINASKTSTAHFFFQGIKTMQRNSTTRLYVETSEGTAGIIVAYNGKPLTEEQRQEERARLERFIHNPEELHKKQRQEREEEERTMRIMRALPDAFTFEYAGQETGKPGVGHAGDPLVKLKFQPNPHYRPPSRTEEVLTGMQGEVLIDAAHFRMASIDGTLFKEVGFGWGILGHLDRGGHFIVRQEAQEDQDWEISTMSLKITGKILLVKSLNFESTEVFSGFKRAPSNMTFAEAVKMLEEEAETAQKDRP